MKKAGFILAALASVLALAGLLPQIGDPSVAQEAKVVEYRAYVLHHARAEEVEPALSNLIPPGTDVVVDRQGNRLLVRGSADAQQTVRRALGSLDQPPAATQAKTTPMETVLRTYAAPDGNPSGTAGQLSAHYAGNPSVRIAPDSRTGQILVVAPPAIHAEIARVLPVPRPPFRATTIPTVAEDNPLRQTAAVSPPVEPAPMPHETSEPVSREVRLARRSSRQIESALQKLLGERMQARPDNGTGVAQYRVLLPGGETLGLWIGRQTSRVVVRGSEPAVASCVRLIEALDEPATEAGQSVQLVPVRNARRDQIERAVRAVQDGGLRPGDSAAVVPRPTSHQTMLTRLFQDESGAPGRPLPKAAPPPGAGDGTPEPPGPVGPEGQPPAEGTEPGFPEVESGRLSGPVQIQPLEGFPAIIVTGRGPDVERVIKLIEDLDRLAAIMEPVIELVPLRHTESEAMAALVTQLYADMLSPGLGAVSITPLVKPNALLLIGRRENVDYVISKLIDPLDKPVAPTTQFRVFYLKHAAALSLEQKIEEFFAEEPAGLGTRILVTADYRANALIARAAPRDMVELADLIEQLDIPQSPAVNEIRVFKLQNTLAEDLAPILQEAIGAQTDSRFGTGRPTTTATGAAAGPAATTGPGGIGALGTEQRSTALQFITVDRSGQQRKLSTGIVTDVRVTADPRANAIVVSAPAESMELMKALIEELDQLPAAEAQVKVFSIINGDAPSLLEMLESLFGEPTAQAQQLPLQTAGIEEESALVAIRFAVDARTNSIIASGTAGDLMVVEAILARLDDSDVKQRESVVYKLKNAPAQDVAAAITDFLQQVRQVEQIAPEFMSAFEQIQREVVVVAEPVTNSLVISATPRFFKEVIELVEKIDERPPMVVIQVVIAEVALGSVEELGVEFGLQDTTLFDRGGPGDPGFNFNNFPLGNVVSDLTLGAAHLFAGQALSNFGLGRVSGEVGYGGLVLSGSSNSVNVLIRALKENSCVDVLARPQVMTLNNQPAFVQVGERVPQVTGTGTNQTGQTSSITYDNVGVILGVTPRIAPDGLVVMEIDADQSELGPESEGVPISFSATGEVIRAPRVRTRNVQTTVSARTGQTVIIGGLISKTHGTVRRRVPVIGDMPVIGNLFRFDSETEAKAELLIIMTPHIVESDEDADRIKQMEAARINWCMADVLELHGDGGFRGRTDEWYDSETQVIYPDLDPTAEKVPSPKPMPGMPGPQPTPAQRMPPVPEAPLTPLPGTPGQPEVSPPSQLRLKEPPSQPLPRTPLPELPGQSQYRPPAPAQQAWSGIPPRSHPISPVVLPAGKITPADDDRTADRGMPAIARGATYPRQTTGRYDRQAVRPVAHWEPAPSDPAQPRYRQAERDTSVGPGSGYPVAGGGSLSEYRPTDAYPVTEPYLPAYSYTGRLPR